MIRDSFDDAMYDSYNEDEEINKIINNNSTSFINLNNVKKLKFDDVEFNIHDFGDVKKYFTEITSHEAYFSSYSPIDYIAYKYNKINKQLPNIFKIEDVNALNFINTLILKYNFPLSSYYRILLQTDNTSYSKIGITPTIITLSEDLVLYVENKSSLVLFYNYSHEYNKNSYLYKILGLLKNFRNPKTPKNKIYVVYKTQEGFGKTGFDVKKIKVNLEENYNDDFLEISNKIIKGLNNKKESHLVLLSSSPGYGKTFYVRFLTSKLKKNIIFISPDMVDYITDPSFIPFLMKNNDSILVIEDAEPALQKRGNGGRSGAISNILNLTDGLLSDCLNISIIATYNTNNINIDEALLRKGRLLMNYKFEKLSKEKSTKLLNKLGYNVKANEDMSLADIYNYEQDNNTEKLNIKTQIKGFNNK